MGTLTCHIQTKQRLRLVKAIVPRRIEVPKAAVEEVNKEVGPRPLLSE